MAPDSLMRRSLLADPGKAAELEQYRRRKGRSTKRSGMSSLRPPSLYSSSGSLYGSEASLQATKHVDVLRI